MGHAPLYSIPFSYVYWFTVSGYIQFSLFITSILLLACTNIHARFIQLLNCMIVIFPFFACTFFYCVYNSYTLIRSFAALQHLNFAGISLEFYIYWHMLPGLSIYQWIFITWIHGNITHITRMVNRGLQVSMILIIACWGHDCDCTCMSCIVINIWFSKFPWVIHTVYIEKHPPLTCIQIVYTGFSPSLSKYGVYNFSPLIVLCTYSQLCAMHLFSLVFAASYRT